MRVYQWTKNLFIFLPLFFSGNLFVKEKFLLCLSAFFAFSFLSSSVYIINDILDKEADKLHPEKKNRPIASGKISLNQAFAAMTILSLSSLTFAYFLFHFHVFNLMVFYFIINILYSIKLKHISILDIMIIAIGFIIRIMTGGELTNVVLSKWLVLMTFLLSVFLALTKRRDDLIIIQNGGQSTRRSLDGYNIEFVNYSMIFISSIIVVSYIMYTISDDIKDHIKSNHFYVTSFFVLLGMLRYIQLAFVENKTGSPSKVLLSDRFTIINLLLWAALIFYFIYFYV